LNPRKLASRQV